MRTLVSKAIGVVVASGWKVAAQVIVSVTATLCVAMITNASLGKGTADEAPAPARVGTAAAAAAPPLSAPPDAFKSRVAAPAEFGAVFGFSRASFASEGGEWSAQPAPAPVRSAAARPRVASPPASPEGPPPRPPSVAVASAPLELQAAGAAPEDARKPVRLFGVALPAFVPSGKTIVNSVASLGDAVAGLVDRL
jgi:hypothetical protein